MTNSSLILTEDNPIYHVFKWLVTERRMVFIAGLPGVGKTLLLQQLAFMAQDAGRTVHTLQWDEARIAFETPALLKKYPETNGASHPAILKGVGLWAREGVLQWHAKFSDPKELLIGEMPLIGNRLSELANPHSDLAEQLLKSNQAVFLIPMPTREVRQVIEAARKRSIAQPRNELEKKDTSPEVLQMLWQEVYKLAEKLELISEFDDGPAPYDPMVYSGVYMHLLKHRHVQVLPLDRVLVPRKSAYELEIKGTALKASAETVKRMMAQIEAVYSPAQLRQTVENWYQV